MTDPIRIKCGDSRTLRVTFRDATTGDPVDLTGCRVSWTVRTTGTLRSSTDVDAVLALVDANPANPTAGAVTWSLTPTMTRHRPGVYVWDAQLVDGAGHVSSTETGQVEFVQDVTKDIA